MFRRFGIAKEITTGIYSDSTLTMRGGKKRGSAVHLLSTEHPQYFVNAHSIVGGATLRSILSRMPRDAGIIAKDDVTLVTCMFNEVVVDKIT